MEKTIRLFDSKLIFRDIKVKDKEECIAKMVNCLAESEVLSDKDAFLNTVMEREAIMSTGIGRNVALPHGRSDLVKTVRSVVFLFKNGIDFQAVDDEPVQLVVLTASPKNESHIYMLMLKHLTEYLRQPEKRDLLFKVASKDELIKIMKGIENEVNKDLADN